MKLEKSDGKIVAPFSDEEIKKFESMQSNSMIHGYTCCSPKDIANCLRAKGESNGKLEVTADALVCPCGEYTQEWFQDFSH